MYARCSGLRVSSFSEWVRARGHGGHVGAHAHTRADVTRVCRSRMQRDAALMQPVYFNIHRQAARSLLQRLGSLTMRICGAHCGFAPGRRGLASSADAIPAKCLLARLFPRASCRRGPYQLCQPSVTPSFDRFDSLHFGPCRRGKRAEACLHLVPVCATLVPLGMGRTRTRPANLVPAGMWCVALSKLAELPP